MSYEMSRGASQSARSRIVHRSRHSSAVTKRGGGAHSPLGPSFDVDDDTGRVPSRILARSSLATDSKRKQFTRTDSASRESAYAVQPTRLLERASREARGSREAE